MKHNINFYWLDLLRGSAAMLVFLSHIRALFFLDYHHVDHTILSAFFYFVTGFGHSSVIIFFVLSGFFIIGSIDNAVIKSKWSFSTYMTDRLVRLWVVLIPALLLTSLVDNIGVKLYPNSLAYLGEIDSLKDINPTGRSSIIVLVANTLFLQNILVPTFGSNAPLWSLTCEFWYYLLFPFLYFALFKKVNIGTRIAYIVIPSLLLLFLSKDITLYFIIWLMGGGVYYFYTYKKVRFFSNTIFITSIVFLFLATLSGIRFEKYPFFFNDYSLGVASSLLIICLTQLEMKSTLLKTVSKFISDISFTLYLVHLPLSIVLVSAMSHERQDFKYSTVFVFSLLGISIILFSYFFWVLFEKQTPYIKHWVKSRMMPTIPNEG